MSAVNSAQPALSLMVVDGLPTVTFIEAPSHSKSRVGLLSSAQRKSTHRWSKLADSMWYRCAQLTSTGPDNPVRSMTGDSRSWLELALYVLSRSVFQQLLPLLQVVIGMKLGSPRSHSSAVPEWVKPPSSSSKSEL